LFAPKPWATLTPQEIERLLDAASRTMPAEASSMRKGKGKCDSGRLVPAPSKERLDHLSGLASTLGLPDITMSDKDVEDMDQIDQLTVAQAQIERLINLENETVEREKWNHDAAE
jgi:hypothetical protein